MRHRTLLVILFATLVGALVVGAPPFASIAREASREGDEKHRISDSAGKPPATPSFQTITTEQRRAVDRGIRFLVEQQDPHKGFFDPHLDSQDGRVAITALACLALMAHGNTGDRGPYSEPLARGLRYLIRTCHRDDGPLRGYLSTAGDNKSRMHGHGYAALALSEANGMLGEDPESRATDFSGDELRECLTLAIRLIERSQTSSGGWGYEPDRSGDHEGSITVCQLQALRSANNAGITANHLTIRRATEYLHKSQEPDGSFAYSLHDRRTSYALTAAAVSSLHARGIYDSSEVRRGMDYLDRTFDDFLSPVATERFFYYGAFYAAQAMYHANDFRKFEAWFGPVRSHLLRIQAEDGSWPAKDKADDHGSTYRTAMAVLVLEVPYGFLPLFQR